MPLANPNVEPIYPDFSFRFENYKINLGSNKSNSIKLEITDTTSLKYYTITITPDTITNGFLSMDHVMVLINKCLNGAKDYAYTITQGEGIVLAVFNYSSDLLNIREQFILSETVMYSNEQLHTIIKELTGQIKFLENKIKSVSVENVCVPVFSNPRNPHEYKILNLGTDTITFNVGNEDYNTTDANNKLFNETNFKPNNIIFDSICLNNYHKTYADNLKFIASLKFIKTVEIKFSNDVKLKENFRIEFIKQLKILLLNSKKIEFVVYFPVSEANPHLKDYLLDLIRNIIIECHNVKKIKIVNFNQVSRIFKNMLTYCNENSIDFIYMS